MYGDYDYFFTDKSGLGWCALKLIKNIACSALTGLKCDQCPIMVYHNYFPDG